MKEILGTSLVLIGIVVGVVLLLTLPTMWLWNYVMPTVFGLPEISVWQTLVLLILAEIFFKKNINKGE